MIQKFRKFKLLAAALLFLLPAIALGAWPLTPLRTYVANTTPTIRAADLNSIQDGINRIVGATYSLKSVVVDGTGGAIVVPVAGTLQASRSIADGNEPTTANNAWGEISKELVPVAAGALDAVGGVYRGYGITSVGITGNDRIDVVLKYQPTAASLNNFAVVITMHTNPTVAYTLTKSIDGGVRAAFQVDFNNGLNAERFDFIVMGF